MTIITNHSDLFERKLQSFCNDLTKNEMRSLSHISGANAYFCSLQFCFSEDFHCRSRLFWIAERIAHIFHATGNTSTTFYMWSRLLPWLSRVPAFLYLFHAAF